MAKTRKPFEPIVLTEDNDRLREFTDFPIQEGQEMPGEAGYVIGKHVYCGGWFTRRRISDRHQAIICDGCHLRVIVPIWIKTYQNLRQYLSSHLDTGLRRLD